MTAKTPHVVTAGGEGASASASTLVFAPPENPARPRRALAALGLVSLCGHALGFYVLQAFYAPAGTLPLTSSPVARWTLVPTGSAEAEALERWSAVMDPALGAGAAFPRPENVLAGLPPVPYVPSFSEHRPAVWADTTKETPELVAAPSAPGSVLPPAPVLLPPRSRPASSPPGSPGETSITPPRTRVVFPETLRRRLPATGIPPLVPPPLSTTNGLAALPRPVTFLVGARSAGGPPQVFREDSSGVAAADDAARTYLERLSLAPDERPGMVWGRVTVYWGRDVLR